MNPNHFILCRVPRAARIAVFSLAAVLAGCAPRGNPPPADPPRAAALDTMKFFHVALAVADGERAARWYEEKLGFKRLSAKDYPDYGTRIFFLEKAEFHLELIEDRNLSKDAPRRADPPKHTRLPGPSQFSFTVSDVDAVAGELKARGVDVPWGPISYPDLGLSFLFARDVEGNFIQFIQLHNK